jgi:hypothetical protein
MQRPPRPYLRLVTETQPPSGSPLFVENSTMPTLNLSTDTHLTFTFRGLTVPTVEALCAELHARRAAGESLNGTYDLGTTHYGRPYVVITSHFTDGFEDEEIVQRFSWDHTVWSLLEAAEAAKTFNGAVYIDQSVLLSTDVEDGMPDEDGCVPLDEGFSVMVADFMPADSRARFDAQANRDA